MRENEFEKRVREKMDQLGFDPSEAVWAGVDKEINQEKKRRRSFFWLFFCSGLLLAGSGYYFFTTKNNPVSPLKTELHGEINKPKEENISQNQNIKDGQGTMGSKMKQKNKEDGTEITKADAAWKKKPLTLKTTQENLQKNRPADVEMAVIQKHHPNHPDEKSDDISINNYNKTPVKIVTVTEPKQLVDSNKEITKNPLVEIKTTKQDSLTDNKTATVEAEKKQKEKKSKWNIGYTAGAGISNINQSLFTPLYASANSIAIPTGAASGSISTSSSPHSNPGFSFMAGAFVTKGLSERFSLTAGLNYHYYSTRIMTGSKITGNPPVGFSTYQLLDASSYYQNGNDHSYTNKYHFLEIPVTAGFQLIKSKKTPVLWELGFSLAYLLSNNALYYDPFANVYFASNQGANKMQVNAVTAILFSLHANKNEWQIGPQFQYGLTDMYTAQTNNPGHLIYGGIKINFIPRKK